MRCTLALLARATSLARARPAASPRASPLRRPARLGGASRPASTVRRDSHGPGSLTASLRASSSSGTRRPRAVSLLARRTAEATPASPAPSRPDAASTPPSRFSRVSPLTGKERVHVSIDLNTDSDSDPDADVDAVRADDAFSV